jgi:hypothetical protein
MSPTIEEQVEALTTMRTGVLLERYAEVFGERSRSRHRQYLIRRIAWRIQANAEGGITERARRRAEELTDESEVRRTSPREAPPLTASAVVHKVPVAPPWDPRLPPPGTALTREYKGGTVRVLVQSDGLEWGGKRFKSLSAVAKAITGTHVNGYRFFGLRGEA